MTANLILSFNVVTPLFLEMLLGFILRKINLLDKPTSASLNRLTFKCFLPLMIFQNIYTTDLSVINDYSYMLFAVAGLLIVFLILMLLIPRFEKDKRKCGVIIQAGFRSNFVLFGMPVAASLLGEERTGPIALLIAVVIPLYNVLAVVDLEYFRGETVNIRNVAKGIITNPLIIGSLLGILINVSGLRLPTSVESAVSSIAKVATPLALMALGADFRIDAFKDYWKELTAGLLLKLFIVPAAVLSIAAAMGYRDEKFVGLMLAFAAPVAVNSYIMAEMMDGDGVLASQLVFYSTLFSIGSLFIIIFITKSLGLY